MKIYLDCFFRMNYTLIAIMVLIGCQDNSQTESGTAAVDAEHALSTFKVPPGFKIELVAAEPMIAGPVDMEIDEYGNFYVVEMPGYPLDKSGSGKIILLKDTDGDGRMDKRTVFAKGLMLPNGILRWKKGILITDAPNVLYLEDTNGDGVAEIRDTMLTGFSLSNPHVNVNNPVYGIDNWIYLAHRGAISIRNYEKEFGDKGREVYFPANPGAIRLPQNAGSHSVRFRPEGFKLEMTANRAQFGQTFDAWGRYLLAENGNHSYQEVVPNRYLRRNPDLFISEATQSLSDHGNVSEIFPITKIPERQLFSGVGVMTSSSGITSYLGGIFPAPYDKNITFVCESVSNLVHVDVLNDDGASFKSSRVLPNSEFLASTDAWSRPVNMYVGPDGALYVLDYYRQIIEHPEWMSEEAVKAGGLYNGNDMGRIYRITPTSTPAAEWMKGLKLGSETSESLVEKLSSPNVWWRLNAQRLLVDRSDKTAVPALIKMVKNNSSSFGRLHAIWTLEGMGMMDPEVIVNTLKDPIAGVRENAVKIAEIHLKSSPELSRALLSMVDDPDAKVRYQLLLTLGFVHNPQSAEVRNKILIRDISDKWVQIAAISASSSETVPLLKMVIEKYKHDVPAYSSLVQRLTTMVGVSGTPATVHQFIQNATAPDPGKRKLWQGAMLEGLAMGMETRKSKANENINAFKSEQAVLIRAFFENPEKGIRDASLHFLNVIGLSDQVLTQTAMNRCVSIAGNKSLSAARRTEALNFLALRDVNPHIPFLKSFLSPGEDLSIQLAALKTLITIGNNSICDYLLQQWPALTPELREVAIGAFLVNPERVAILLDAIESGKVTPASLGWVRTAKLMSYTDDKLRKRARSLLAKNDEAQVNKDYQSALQIEGDTLKGKMVFLQNCGRCHQVRNTMGIAFGPDLGTVHNWLPQNIMANILAPNLSIAAGFDLWEVDLKNGKSLQGIISSETSAAITLKSGPGIETVINRQDITSLRSVNVSAMPSGLEKDISQEQMADLIAYLRKNN